jgi:hypothetical protein
MAKGEISAIARAAISQVEAGRESFAVSVVGAAVIFRLPPSMKPAELAAQGALFLDVLAKGGCKLAVLDGSEVETMDLRDAEDFRKLLVAASLVGAQPVLCGMRPGVAAVLASLDPRFLRGVRVLRDLEEAIESARRGEPAAGGAARGNSPSPSVPARSPPKAGRP